MVVKDDQVKTFLGEEWAEMARDMSSGARSPREMQSIFSLFFSFFDAYVSAS